MLPSVKQNSISVELAFGPLTLGIQGTMTSTVTEDLRVQTSEYQRTNAEIFFNLSKMDTLSWVILQ